MLRAVLPESTKGFWGGIIMPNTDPPIDSVELAASYKEEIVDAIPAGKSFEPLMTFYLTKKLTAADIEKGFLAKTGVKIHAVKFYPFGATTNSQWGYRSILDASDVLKKMEELGMPLLLHGEVHLNDHNEEEDPYEGEALFIKETLPRLLETYPNLKISLEHVSTALGADFIEKNGKAGRLVATLTPHHLMYDKEMAAAAKYPGLLNCKPLLKSPQDREAIRALAAKGLPFISAGTDSAPHPEEKKLSPTPAFGVFSASVAVELYTQIFDELHALDKLENFLSVNGPRFFSFEPSNESLTLVKKDWQVTEPIVTEEGIKVWPIAHKEYGLGNEVIHWQVHA